MCGVTCYWRNKDCVMMGLCFPFRCHLKLNSPKIFWRAKWPWNHRWKKLRWGLLFHLFSYTSSYFFLPGFLHDHHQHLRYIYFSAKLTLITSTVLKLRFNFICFQQEQQGREREKRRKNLYLQTLLPVLLCSKFCTDKFLYFRIRMKKGDCLWRQLKSTSLPPPLLEVSQWLTSPWGQRSPNMTSYSRWNQHYKYW